MKNEAVRKKKEKGKGKREKKKGKARRGKEKGESYFFVNIMHTSVDHRILT